MYGKTGLKTKVKSIFFDVRAEKYAENFSAFDKS